MIYNFAVQEGLKAKVVTSFLHIPYIIVAILDSKFNIQFKHKKVCYIVAAILWFFVFGLYVDHIFSGLYDRLF